MTKQEFEDRIEGSVTQEQYNLIEFVYQWYPTTIEIDKDRMAQIWHIGGMRLIKDMLPTAKKANDLDREIHKLRLDIERCKDIMQQLAAGTMSEEEESEI